MAAERLARLRATAAGVEAAAPPGDPAAAASRPRGAAASAQNRRRIDAYGQFEAFVLQSFIQSMLPRNATNVFGRGSAGEVWRSMLAEQLGGQLASSGQVGIARRLAAGAPQASGNTAGPPVLSAAQLSALSSLSATPSADAGRTAPSPAPARS